MDCTFALLGGNPHGVSGAWGGGCAVGMGEDSGFPEIFGMLPPYCTLANHYLSPWNVPRDFGVYLGLTSLFQGEI